MSPGVTPAWRTPPRPPAPAAVVVKSGIWLMFQWVWAAPVPRT